LTWLTVLALAAFVVTFVAVLASLRTLSAMVPRRHDDPQVSLGPRVRRLRLRRAGKAIGCWQIATGLLLALDGYWSGAIALFGMGGLFLLGAELAVRRGGSPWWAPEVDR